MNTLVRSGVCNWILGTLVLACFVAVVEAERLPLSDKTIEVDLQGVREVLLVVNLEEGDVEVIGEDRPSIEVTVDKFESDDEEKSQAWVDYDAGRGIARIVLGGELRESDLEIRVPETASLRLGVVDGDIEVIGVLGEIEASAVDGSILLAEVAGGIAVNSVDGDVRIELTDTRLVYPISLATVDGDLELITAREVDVDLSVSSVDGSFTTDQAYLSRGTQGRKFGFPGVNLSGQLGEGGVPVSLKTIDGDIAIRLKK